jgi:hypothetical protein
MLESGHEQPVPIFQQLARSDVALDLADRLLPPQPAGMSRYPADEEVTSVCADFLVERRGFKLMVIVA